MVGGHVPWLHGGGRIPWLEAGGAGGVPCVHVGGQRFSFAQGTPVCVCVCVYVCVRVCVYVCENVRLCV